MSLMLTVLSVTEKLINEVEHEMALTTDQHMQVRYLITQL